MTPEETASALPDGDEAATSAPSLLAFPDWLEQNQSTIKEPLAKYRGYSDYVKQETLAQGRYSDTLVQKLDAKLAGLAVESGDYTPAEGTEPLVSDVLARPKSEELPLDSILNYAYSPETQDDDPLRTAAANLKARRQLADEGRGTPEELAAAEADLRQLATPELLSRATRKDVTEGRSLAAIVPPSDPEGAPTVEINDALLDFVNEDGTVDEPALGKALKLHNTDPSLIPAIRAKLARPDGYGKSAVEIERHGEAMSQFGTLVMTPDANGNWPMQTEISRIAERVESGQDVDKYLDTQIGQGTLMIRARQFVEGTPLAEKSDAELRDMLKDAALMQAAPELDTEDPSKHVRTTSTGQVVVPLSVMLNDEAYEKVKNDRSRVPLAQVSKLDANRDYALEVSAVDIIRTISDSPQGGAEFVNYMDSQRAAGKKDSEIVKSWISQGNFSATQTHIKNAAFALLDSVAPLAFVATGADPDGFAMSMMKWSQKEDANRRAYAELFGYKPGIGYDLTKLFAPMAVDMGVGLLTGGTAAVATTAVRGSARTAVKSLLRSALTPATKAGFAAWTKAAPRAVATGLAESGIAKAGLQVTGRETVEDLVTMAGRDITSKIVTGSSKAAFYASAFNRTAMSTYASLSTTLAGQTNPDGSAKYSPEEVKEISMTHGLAAGAITVGSMGVMAGVGIPGIEKVFGTSLSRGQLNKVWERLRKDVSKLPPGTDMSSAQAMVSSMVKEGVRPIFSTKTLAGRTGNVLAALPEPVKGALSEAPQEALDDFMQYFNEAIATGDKIDIRKASTNALYSGLLGGFVGGTVTGVTSTVQNRKAPPARVEADIRRERLLEMAGKLEATAPQTAQVFRNYAFQQRSLIPQRQQLEGDLKAAKTPEAKLAIQQKIDTLNDNATRSRTEELAPPEENIPEADAAGEGDVPPPSDAGVAPEGEAVVEGTPEAGGGRRTLGGFTGTPVAQRMRATRETVEQTFSELVEPDETGLPEMTADMRSLLTEPGGAEAYARQVGKFAGQGLSADQREAAQVAAARAELTPSPSPTDSLPEGSVADTGATPQRFKLNKYGGVFDTLYSMTITNPKTPEGVSRDALAKLNASPLNGQFVNGVTLAQAADGTPILVSDGLEESIRLTDAPPSTPPSDTLPGFTMPPRKRSLSSMRDATVDKLDAIDRRLARESDEDNMGVLEAGKQRLTALLGQIETVMMTEAQEARAQVFKPDGEMYPSADPEAVVTIAEAEDVPVVEVVKATVKESLTVPETAIPASTELAPGTPITFTATTPPGFAEPTQGTVDRVENGRVFARVGRTVIPGVTVIPTETPTISDTLADVPEGYPLDRDTAKLVSTAVLTGLYNGMMANPVVADAVKRYAASKGVDTGNDLAGLALIMRGELEADSVLAELRGDTPPPAKDVKAETIAWAEAQIASLPKTEPDRPEKVEFTNSAGTTYRVVKTRKNLEEFLKSARKMETGTPKSRKPVAKNFPKAVISKDTLPRELRRDDSIITGLQDPEYRAKLVKRLSEAEVTQLEDIILAKYETTREELSGETRNLPSSTPSSAVTAELNKFGFSEGLPAFLVNVAKRGQKQHRALAKLLLDVGAGGVPVDLADLPNSFFAGQFQASTGRITVNTAKEGPRGTVDTVLHELVHAATEQSLRRPTEAQAKVIARIERVRRTIIKRAKQNKTYDNDLQYALGDNAEFLTHFFTSQRFRDQVSAMTPKSEKNWIQVIADLIADLFTGRTRAQKMEADLRKELTTLITTPRIGLAPSDVIMRLPAENAEPDFAAAEQKFNNQVNEYVTGNWPSDTEGRYAELMSFAGQWAATYTGVTVRVENARNAPSTVDVNSGRDAVAQFGGETALRVSQRELSESGAKIAVAHAINEEVIHVAHLNVVKERLGEGTTYGDVAEEVKSMVRQMLTLPNRKTRDAFASAAYETYISYTGQPFNQSIADDPAAVLLAAIDMEDSAAGYSLGYEMVRQAVQMRVFGATTENVRETLLGRIIDFFQDRLKAIRRLASNTRVLGERFSKDIIETEAAVRSLRGDIRFQPTSDARNVARFHQLTESLYRGRDEATAAEIEAWKAENVGAWEELSAMRIDGQPPITAGRRVTPDRWADAASPDIRFQPAARPALLPTEQQFNETINQYVTGEWNPAQREARTDQFVREYVQRFAPTADRLGWIFKFTESNDVVADLSERGKPQIEFGMAGMRGQVSGSEVNTFRTVAKMVEEEFIHAAHLHYLTSEVADQGQRSAEVFRNSAKVFSQIIDSIRSGGGDAVTEAALASLQTYTPTMTLADLVKMANTNDYVAQDNFVNEFVRQMVQMQNGRPTEEYLAENKNFLATFIEWLKEKLASLRWAAQNLNLVSPVLKENVEGVQAILGDAASPDIRFQPRVTPLNENDTQMGTARTGRSDGGEPSMVEDGTMETGSGRESVGVSERGVRPTLRPTSAGEGVPPVYDTQTLREAATGFLPDDVTLDDLTIDFTDLADITEGLDPVNAENVVHAAVNHALARRAGEAAIPAPVRSEFDSDEAFDAATTEHAAEIARLTDTYELITRGRLTSEAMFRYRTNPGALTRLVDYLTAAVKAAYARFTARYDVGTAVALNRMSRDLARAKVGFNHDIEPMAAYDADAVMMLPASGNQDAEYLAAVEAGDMETAQRMVDKAAKKAGYDINRPVYHGTGVEFDIFKPSDTGRYGSRIYTTTDEATAMQYAVSRAKLNGGTPRVIKLYAEKYAAKTGDIVTSSRSSDFKSADPVTYDNGGNVIPLSQRFQSTSPDIRFQPAARSASPALTPQERTRLENELLNRGAKVDFLSVLYKGDIGTTASVNKAESENKYIRRITEMFVNTHGKLSVSHAKADKNKDAAITTVEEMMGKMKNNFLEAARREDVDMTLVQIAMGNIDPPLTPDQEKKISDDFIAEVKASEAEIKATYEQEKLTNPLKAKDNYDDAITIANAEADRNRKKAIWIAQGVEAEKRKVQQLEALIQLERTAPDTAEVVKGIRGSLNQFQRLAKEVNKSNPEILAIIDQTFGVYLVRSFGIHQDPKQIDLMLHSEDPFYKERKTALVNFFMPMAKEEIIRQYRQDPDFMKTLPVGLDEDAVIDTITTRFQSQINDRALLKFEDFMLARVPSSGPFAEGSTVANEIQRYMKKSNMPQEFLDALMVNEDPIFNAMNTMMSLGRLVFHSRMLNEIHDSGIEAGQFITEAERASGITYADGKNEMRRVFGVDGTNENIKSHVVGKLTNELMKIAKSQYANGVLDTMPDRDMVKQQAEKAMKDFASAPTVSLADLLPQLGRSADRFATDAFISYDQMPVEVRNNLQPRPGRFSGWQPVFSSNVGNSAFAPLGGLLAEPEYVKAMQATFRVNSKGVGHFSDDFMGQAHRYIVGAAGASLGIITQGNPSYYTRNILGNTVPGAMNGVSPFDPKKAELAMRTIRGMISTKGEITNEMIELIAGRIILDAPQIGLIKQLIEDVMANPAGAMEDLTSESASADIKAGKLAKGSKKAAKAFIKRIGKFAEASEAFSKIMVYADFKDILTEANWGSELEIFREASRLTNEVMPARSETPTIVDSITRSGFGALLSPFLRFRVDIIRCTVNSFKLANEWRQSDNPVLRKQGMVKTAAWFGTVGILTVGFPLIMRSIFGFDDEDDRYVRAANPVYNKDASLIYFRQRDENGNVIGLNTMNLTYTNPLASFGDPLSRIVNAVISNEPSEIPGIMGRYFVGDVLGENIVAGAVIDTWRNRDSNTGLPIHLEAESDLDKALKKAMHIGKAYTPKIGTQAYKFLQALEREEEDLPYNKPWGVLFATFAPFTNKASTFDDMDKSIFRRIHRDTAELSALTFRATSRAPLNPGDIAAMFEKHQQLRIQQGKLLRDHMERSVNIRGGGDKMRDVVKNAFSVGYSRKSVGLLINQNVVERIQPSKEKLQKMKDISPVRPDEFREWQDGYSSKIPLD